MFCNKLTKQYDLMMILCAMHRGTIVATINTVTPPLSLLLLSTCVLNGKMGKNKLNPPQHII